MTGDKEMAEHYYAVAEDLTQRLAVIQNALHAVESIAQFYSERAVRDHARPSNPGQGETAAAAGAESTAAGSSSADTSSESQP